jgi:hypothetical protein
VGTILNLNRVEGPRFQPLYQRLDELKRTLNDREALLQRLDEERRAYDRGVVQRGLLTLGGAVGVLALLIIVLAVLLSR